MNNKKRTDAAHYITASVHCYHYSKRKHKSQGDKWYKSGVTNIICSNEE